MRVLFLSHCLPYPPNKGDKVRAYHSLRHLSREHEVHLLCLAREEYEIEEVPALAEYCSTVGISHLDSRKALRRAAGALLGSEPLTLAYYRSAAFAKRVDRIVRQQRIEAVVTYCSSMAPYAGALGPMPKVIDFVDVDSAKWAQFSSFTPWPLRMLYSLEAKRLERYERSLIDEFDHIYLSTEKEREIFLSFAPRAAPKVVRNGVDFDFFRPLDLPKNTNPCLVFTGQMDYFPNVDGVSHFSQQILPRLRQRFPDVEFLVVGRSPTVAVQRLESLPGVSIIGEVVDVRPFMARSWVFVAPLRIARGVQNKVLEAMAMKLPVVCTEAVMGGLAGGDIEPGRELLVASAASGFEDAVAQLLENPERRTEMGVAARNRIRRDYSWTYNMRELDGIMADLARLRSERNLPAHPDTDTRRALRPRPRQQRRPDPRGLQTPSEPAKKGPSTRSTESPEPPSQPSLVLSECEEDDS